MVSASGGGVHDASTAGALAWYWARDVLLIAGITMALRRPRKRMKLVRRRAVFSIVWRSYPSPPLLDSSLRWNDEISRGSLTRIGVQDMLS